MRGSPVTFSVLAVLAGSALAQTLMIDDTDPGIDYEPSGEWELDSGAAVAALDAYNSTFHFTSLSGNTSDPSSGVAQATATWTFPVAASGFVWYGFQRSDAGLYQICFDCDGNNPIQATVDALNTTSTGSDPPIVLYSTSLDMGIHTVLISNLFDSRHGSYGQITIDAFGLTGASGASGSGSTISASTTSSTGSSSSTTSSSSSSTSSMLQQTFPTPKGSTTSHSITGSNLPSTSPSTTPKSGAQALVPASALLASVLSAVLAML
ncbi:hypothetical protein CALVIDRAFT_552454 [Calocera viscosa TUFC12733]|uniref:Lytic polysaccharide monooxygenase n=1 Tax=Calocera viscosa (strain TUFC12733) TaxID=1330018 RepID=A0A167RAP0_CALVF|nr:hypothetical protein CALVIDRAFT_552454 [Calocera viscosa TUFC12733]